MDADGCLYVPHVPRHMVGGKKYQNIGLCFTSFSHKLIEQVATIFEEFGITPHISGTGRNIYLYSEKVVARYMSVFGTSNERIRSVYAKIK